MASWDVIVVGAGPAGSMAASAVRPGQRVLLVDKRRVVGHPVQCAGGLSAQALSWHGLKPDPSWVLVPIEGIRNWSPDGTSSTLRMKGYEVDRARFDQALAARAQEHGAELRLERRLRALSRHDGLWRADFGAEQHEAPIILGADGPESTVARLAGLPRNTRLFLGYQYVLPVREGMLEPWFELFWSSALQGGYTWIFPRGETANVGVGGGGFLKPYLDAFCRAHGLDPEKRCEINAGKIPVGGPVSPLVRNGIALVGDAGGLCNPCTGGGIHAALHSGVLAGRAAGQAVTAEDPAQLAAYEARVRREPYAAPVLAKAAEIFSTLRDEEWSFLNGLSRHRLTREVPLSEAFWGLLRHPRFWHRARDFYRLRSAAIIYEQYGW